MSKLVGSIDVAASAELLRKCSRSLVQEISDDARRHRRQYVGGPANGQRFTLMQATRNWLAVRIKRGKWAAYYCPSPYDDGRAWFVGEAASERKARQLALRHGPKLKLAHG